VELARKQTTRSDQTLIQRTLHNNGMQVLPPKCPPETNIVNRCRVQHTQQPQNEHDCLMAVILSNDGLRAALKVMNYQNRTMP